MQTKLTRSFVIVMLLVVVVGIGVAAQAIREAVRRDVDSRAPATQPAR